MVKSNMSTSTGMTRKQGQKAGRAEGSGRMAKAGACLSPSTQEPGCHIPDEWPGTLSRLKIRIFIWATRTWKRMLRKDVRLTVAWD